MSIMSALIVALASITFYSRLSGKSDDTFISACYRSISGFPVFNRPIDQEAIRL